MPGVNSSAHLAPSRFFGASIQQGSAHPFFSNNSTEFFAVFAQPNIFAVFAQPNIFAVFAQHNWLELGNTMVDLVALDLVRSHVQYGITPKYQQG